MSKEIKIGLIGAGWMGKAHTTAFHNARMIFGDDMPVFELVSDVSEDAVAKFAKNMGYNRYTTNWMDVVTDPAIDLVDVATPNCMHYEMAKAALEHGKHVFCEKPLGTDVEQCKAAEKVIEAHPDLIFQLGFMRRFDKSYAEAKRKIDNGDIGKVVLVRSYTQDPRSTIESTLKFAPHSGGQYLDMCVHDIDLIRWFTGSNVKNVWAIGGVFEFDLYKELNDADNAAATIQMENGAMGFMFTNRTHAAGCNVETEIIGTHGTLRIANVGAKNLLNIVDEHGSREEYYPDFMSRWHEAFVAEMVAFTGHVRDNTKPADLTVYDGTAVSEAAYRCKESFETGKMLPIR